MVEGVLVGSGEHDTRLPPDREFTGEARTHDGLPGDLPGDRPHGVLEYLGEDAQRAVRPGAEALGDHQHLLSGHEVLPELLTHPVDAEGVHAHHDDVGPVQTLRDLAEVVRLHVGVELHVQVRVDAARPDRVDDRVVEVRADQPDRVAVVARRDRECGRHDAGT